MRVKLKRRETGGPLPFVFMNVAMAADGKIATTNHAVSSFGSPRDLAHLFELRATADAVMSGARTVNVISVDMGPGSMKYRRQRVKRGLAEFNLRIVVSGSGSVNPNARVFQERFSPVIVLTTDRAPRERLEALRKVAGEVRICGRKEIDFDETLRWLRRKWGVKRLLCEGGGEVNGALFDAGVVNELNVTVCPRIIGGRAAPTFAEGLGAGSLACAAPLELKSANRHGDEMFLVYRVHSGYRRVK